MLPIYAEICKIDEDQRMVFGYASTEKRDQQGEIIRRAAIETALPAYMKFANIREMHEPSAVGLAQEANMDPKGLWLGAKVIDDRAWLKCKTRVYKGFSIGGRVTARDPDDKSIITGLELTEISLVDRPANPEALFEIVKRNAGMLMPQPVQKWDCGVADHQHTEKKEACQCMVDRMEKGSPDQPRDDHGRWEGGGSNDRMASYHEKQAPAFVHDFNARFTSGREKAEYLKTVSDAKLHTAFHMLEGHLDAGSKMVRDYVTTEASRRGLDLGHTGKFALGDTVVKRQPHLSTGKFGTHAAAAKEAKDQADHHASEAVKHREKEVKHRKNAEKARNAGDARGVGIHEKLAGSAAALAENHEQSAAQYHELAARHGAAAKSETPAEVKRMPKSTVTDVSKQATDTVAQLQASLLDGVSKVAIMHTDEAREARESALEHEKSAASHETAAATSRENAAKAHSDGKTETADEHESEAEQHEVTAAHHHELADGYHELHAHHMEHQAGGDIQDHGDQAKKAMDIGGEHAAMAEKHKMMADHHDKLRSNAATANDTEDAEHHAEMHKAYTEAHGRRDALAKRMGALHEHHAALAVAAKGTPTEEDGKNPLATQDDPVSTKKADLVKTADGWTHKDGSGWFGKREFTDEERQHAADKGHALPDGSFPIENKEDLKDAILAFGRAKDKAEAKAHIVARAKELGATDMLPQDWEGSTKKGMTVKCSKCAASMPHDVEKCQNCGEPMHKVVKTPAERKAAKVARLGSVQKGIIIVSELAHILHCIQNLQQNAEIEQFLEGDDDDPTPAKLKDLLTEVADCLVQVVQNETREILEDEDVDVVLEGAEPTIVERAAKSSNYLAQVRDVMKGVLFLTKVDLATKSAARVIAEKFDKRAGGIDTAAKSINDKLAQAEVDREAALKSLDAVTAAMKGIAKDIQNIKKDAKAKDDVIGTLKSQLKRFEDLPMPTRAVSMNVRKSDDTGGDDRNTIRKNEGGLLDQALTIADPKERAAFILKNATNYRR